MPLTTYAVPRISSLVVTVILTDEALSWYGSLDAADQAAMDRMIAVLERDGVSLGYPQSTKVNIAKKCAMRELRTTSHGRDLRAFHVFDPRRQAVLTGGDTTGKGGRFYEQQVAFAEKVYEQYLVEQKRGDHDKKK